MSYQSYSTSVSPAQVEARLQEAPRDIAGFIIQIFGAFVILLTTIIGIYVMFKGGSEQLDFSTGEVRQSGSVGVGIAVILAGVVYGAMFIGFGRLVVYVRKMASVLTGMAIVAESAGGTQEAMRVATSPLGGGWGGTPTSGPVSAPTQTATPTTPTTPSATSQPSAPIEGTPAASGPRSFSPPRGPDWLPDPTARHEYRYWDGTKYTDRVGDRGVESSDPI